MIDTHAHLNFPELLNQIDAVVAQSKKAGLTGIIVASSNLADSRIALNLAQKYRGFLWASVGIHPQKTDPENNTSIRDQLIKLDDLLASNSASSTSAVKKSLIGKKLTAEIVAIGECGLDFGPAAAGEEERSRKEQEELFLGQIRLALKYDLPLIIHARKANDEVIEIIQAETKNLKPETKLRGVFHCYSGGKKRIEKILNLPGEWYFGVDGNLTYDSGLQNVVAQIPKDRLLLETDAPFLAPEPYRGQTCYPYYLPLIAKKVAEIWNETINQVVIHALENTQRLFAI